MCVVWLYKKTSKGKEEYLKAKREARRVDRNVLNEEWLEMGKSLQTNFHRNQEKVLEKSDKQA